MANNVARRFYAQGEQIGGTPYFYTKNHLGSIREITDANATIVGHNSYDLYGRLSESVTTVESTFGYTGMYRHQKSGLDLTLYRAYDPELGRWISRDPIAEQGGLNLYEYVGNRPVRDIDAYGLDVKIKYKDGSEQTFANASELMDGLRNSPDGSISEIDISGHGNQKMNLQANHSL